MNIMKFIKFGFILTACLFALSGCGQSKVTIVEGKVNVVTSFYPLYDFTQKIGGEHVHAINLIPAGVEPHDWTPKSKDMTNITKANLLVYNGAGLEGWIHDFLESLKKDSMLAVVEASKGIELIKGNAAEGHEVGDDEEHGDEAHEGHEEEEHGEAGHGEYDPHVWLSPLQAKTLAENIKNGLILVDERHRADYEANFKQLSAQLDELHAKYVEVTSRALRKDIIVSHQALGYLTREYRINQIPIMGISPESEPTAQDIKEISQFAKEHQVKYILFEELVSPRLAKTLANDLNMDTLIFNPLEGLTEDQQQANEDYISLMEKNLASLEKALQ